MKMQERFAYSQSDRWDLLRWMTVIHSDTQTAPSPRGLSTQALSLLGLHGVSIPRLTPVLPLIQHHEKRRKKKKECLKHKVSRGASVFTVLPRADPGKERAISGIVQRLKEAGGRNVGGKSGVDTVPPSTEFWQLVLMGWEEGWEGSEMGREKKAPEKSLSPADSQRNRPSPSRRSHWGERQWVAEETGRGMRATCVPCTWQAAGSTQLPPKSWRKEFASLPQKHSSGCKSKCMDKM